MLDYAYKLCAKALYSKRGHVTLKSIVITCTNSSQAENLFTQTISLHVRYIFIYSFLIKFDKNLSTHEIQPSPNMQYIQVQDE